jgi:hypothetical protein
MNQRLSPMGKSKAAVRWLLLVAVALTSIGQAGCQVFGRNRNHQIAAPLAFESTPTTEQIIRQITQQTANVRQLQSDVRVSIDGMPTLRGTLAVEKPDQIRLIAGLLGVSEMGIDVGNNSDRFWIWSKASLPGVQPAIYFARHSEYQSSAMRQMIPLEPKWLIDALGLVEFDPADRHEGPFVRPDRRYEIHSFHRSPKGYVTRVTVVDPRFGWINQQTVYDETGHRIAYADSIKYEYYPELNVSLPKRIELHVFQPDGKSTTVVVDASTYKINSIYGDPEKLWAMPTPSDVQVVDLASAGPGPLVMESAQAPTPSPHRYDHLSSQRDERPRDPLGPMVR